MPDHPTILFAGGGTGGHIFPNLAIIERLHERGIPFYPVLVVSSRRVDANILQNCDLKRIELPILPFPSRPWHWFSFLQSWLKSIRKIKQFIADHSVKAVVATGGFVSGPVVFVASRLGLPSALVNLDAVPGKANRWLARRATSIFSVYSSTYIPTATLIGMPLRRSIIGPSDKRLARKELGLDPDRETLLITAGSQGASTLNHMMAELIQLEEIKDLIRSWQVIHLCGDKDQDLLIRSYQQAGIPARVEPFCRRMGLAWASASLAISRAGAGSVAEAWANAIPTFFYPYPWHKDKHQQLNAQPLTSRGLGFLMTDLIDPSANARALAPRLQAAMTDTSLRQRIAEELRRTTPPDGASVVADWVCNVLRGKTSSGR